MTDDRPRVGSLWRARKKAMGSSQRDVFYVVEARTPLVVVDVRKVTFDVLTPAGDVVTFVFGPEFFVEV